MCLITAWWSLTISRCSLLTQNVQANEKQRWEETSPCNTSKKYFENRKVIFIYRSCIRATECTHKFKRLLQSMYLHFLFFVIICFVLNFFGADTKLLYLSWDNMQNRSKYKYVVLSWAETFNIINECVIVISMYGIYSLLLPP